MPSIISRFLTHFIESSLNALRRHPAEILIGISMAMLFSLSVEDIWHDSDLLAAFMIIASLAWLPIFSISCLHHLQIIKTPARIGFTAGFLILTSVYGFHFFDANHIAEFWRWAVLMVSFTAALMLVPLTVQTSSTPREVRFWRFNTRLLLRAAVCSVYLGLLYLGLSIGLNAIFSLFDIDAYRSLQDLLFHMAIWIFIAFGPWMMVSSSDSFTDLDQAIPEAAISWIARLGSFLILPLISLYLLITYAYSLRVVFTDFAPSNVISPMILGAGFLGFLGLYLVEPLRHRDGFAFLSRVFQFFPVAFALVLPLSVWAIFERINQYGWTEFRYLRLLAVACFAILCVYGAIQLFRRQAMNLSAIPMVVAAAFLLASMGPWSASKISKVSQFNRLIDAAEQLEILTTEGTVESEQLRSFEGASANQISASARYIRSHHGKDTLHTLAPPHLDSKDLEQWSSDLRYHHANHSQSHTIYLKNDGKVHISQGGTLYAFDRYAHERNTFHSSHNLDVKIEGISAYFKLNSPDLNPQIWTVDLTRLIEFGAENPAISTLPEEITTFPVFTETGAQVGELLPGDISFNPDDSDPIFSLHGHLLIYE